MIIREKSQCSYESCSCRKKKNENHRIISTNPNGEMRMGMNTSYCCWWWKAVAGTVQIYRGMKIGNGNRIFLWIGEETMEKRYIILKIEDKG